jgi:heme exporter protein C
MHPSMFAPLLVMIIGFYCFYALVLILNTRAQVLERERKASWVQDLVAAKSNLARSNPEESNSSERNVS